MILSPELARQHAALEVLLALPERPPPTARIAMLTKSEANTASHQHWTKRDARVRSQGETVAWHLRTLSPAAIVRSARLGLRVQRPLVVLLTRIAPRALDSADNLPGSLKAVRDAVAAELGIDDRTTLVTWLYDQEKGTAAVEILIVQSSVGGAVVLPPEGKRSP